MQSGEHVQIPKKALEMELREPGPVLTGLSGLLFTTLGWVLAASSSLDLDKERLTPPCRQLPRRGQHRSPDRCLLCALGRPEGGQRSAPPGSLPCLPDRPPQEADCRARAGQAGRGRLGRRERPLVRRGQPATSFSLSFTNVALVCLYENADDLCHPSLVSGFVEKEASGVQKGRWAGLLRGRTLAGGVRHAAALALAVDRLPSPTVRRPLSL